MLRDRFIGYLCSLFLLIAISTRSDPGQRSSGNPDLSMPSRNSPILHQTPIHQQSPQMNGGSSNVIGLREKPGLYGAPPSTISRPAWKWWRYFEFFPKSEKFFLRVIYSINISYK